MKTISELLSENERLIEAIRVEIARSEAERAARQQAKNK